MLNQVVLVGRLTKDPEVRELEDGKKVSSITLAVQRTYKNEEGVYEADFINIDLWNGIAQNTSEYCKKGDIIGVKGSIKTNSYEDKETEENKFRMSIQADKVTFLSSKAKEEPESER